jgi:membrane protease subunit HflC
MKRLSLIVMTVMAFFLLSLIMGCYWIVEEGNQGFLTTFGKPASATYTNAGYYVKFPFIQSEHIFEKRVLDWDGNPNLVSTRDKRMIYIDPFARWRITDAKTFYSKFVDESTAIVRLDDVLDGATKTVVAEHDLADVVRSKPRKDDPTLVTFSSGREQLESEILALARSSITNWGIEILDVRLQRVKYESDNLAKITVRMAAERRAVAEKYRSEGQGEAEQILGNRDKEQKVLMSDAQRKSAEIAGKALEKSMAIYASIVQDSQGNPSADAERLYEYSAMLSLYTKMFSTNDVVVLSTTNSFLTHLKGK